MKRKIVWIFVSWMIALSLVIASCGPAAEEEGEVEIEEGEVTIEGEEEEAIEEEVVEEEGLLPPEVPKYGGVLTYRGTIDPMGFDEAYAVHPNITTAFFTNEELTQADWTKGPAGTNETSWTSGFIGRSELLTGSLAESWETPDDETIIFHIREGVHWQNKPPVNGREYTAEDAAYSINRNFTTPTAYLYGAYTRSGYNPTSIKALDKYTLEIKAPQMHGLMVLVCGDFQWSWPREMIEQYGDMKDWRNSCGTGPFILTDYVVASSLTYKRNPNYWMNDPLHPENQLPYVDSIKYMLIPDSSTALAALRTGKLDRMPAVSWENADLLREQCPDMKYVTSYGVRSIAGRIDKEELPFKDIRVRQALHMAIDREEIVEEYYGGHGLVYSYPYLPLPEYEPYYVPFEELPKELQELWEYHPDKARQLLAEAGYPDGFKTKVVCASADVDFLSMIREYFLKVGVDMEIQPLEAGTFTSLSRGRKHEEMIIRPDLMIMFPFRMLEWRIESFDNHSFFEHERTRAAYEAISAAIGKDDAEVARQLKGLVPFMIEQAIQVWGPAYEIYNMWWPWLQNYHGEETLGYFNPHQWTKYVWVDPALKKSMGY